MTDMALQPRFDPATFRRALGHVPTAVCVVTTSDASGATGMTVGSFTAISLEPPLVGFFADTESSTLARIRAAGHYTVSVLGDDQGDLCQTFARRSDDRFAGVALEPGNHTAPRLAGALAWIECVVDSTTTLGDHDVVTGLVTELVVPPVPRTPLVFFRGALSQLDARTVPSKGAWQRDHYAEW